MAQDAIAAMHSAKSLHEGQGRRNTEATDDGDDEAPELSASSGRGYATIKIDDSALQGSLAGILDRLTAIEVYRASYRWVAVEGPGYPSSIWFPLFSKPCHRGVVDSRVAQTGA